jgi:hypothetical protein
MIKLKMSTLRATAAAMVDTGALAAAPSASGMPTLRSALCAEIGRDWEYYGTRADELALGGAPQWVVNYYNERAADEGELYKEMCE